MITAPELEIAVLVLGMVILMVEAFASKIDKRILAFIAITGLAIVFVASFFVAPFSSPNQATGFWSFYTADRLSIFFKQFALLTTILVLIMMIDYAPVVRRSFPGAQDGVGEFFAIPIFTCAGLMYLVSAIDFVFIFVSLELVTISFYVLVSFTRRNPITLEAGTKYLVLSTVSTAFLVYGIAWIFGVTGQTNLHQLTQALANPDVDRSAALLGMVFVLVALGFKIAAVPFQIWVPDVYQGAPTPVTAYLSVGSKAAGFVVLLRVLLPFLTLPQTQRLIVLIALLTLIYGNLFAGLLRDNYQNSETEQRHQQVSHQIESNRADIETDNSDKQIARMGDTGISKQPFKVSLGERCEISVNQCEQRDQNDQPLRLRQRQERQ